MDDPELELKAVLMGRDAPFPDEIQGRWVLEEEPSAMLDFVGSEFLWRGEIIEHVDKQLTRAESGELLISPIYEDDMDPEDMIFIDLIYEGPNRLLYGSLNMAGVMVRP